MSQLRGLDIDDLILMSCLGRGLTLSESAKKLCLSQAAITSRIYKIENVTGYVILDRSTRVRFLTDDGQMIAEIFTNALAILQRVSLKVVS